MKSKLNEKKAKEIVDDIQWVSYKDIDEERLTNSIAIALQAHGQAQRDLALEEASDVAKKASLQYYNRIEERVALEITIAIRALKSKSPGDGGAVPISSHQRGTP